MLIQITDWYGTGMAYTLNITPGCHMVVGKNGSGKTTLLHQLKEYAEKNDIPVFSWDNYLEGGQRAMRFSEPGAPGMDVRTMATAMTSSEGQRISINLGRTLNRLGKFMAKHKDAKMVLVLFDALDSGWSIDRIREAKDFFRNFVKWEPSACLYNACNSYEFARDIDCLVAKTGEAVSFGNYEKYADFICGQED